jgi:hypothetical protein
MKRRADRNDVVLILCAVFLLLTVSFGLITYRLGQDLKQQHRASVQVIQAKNDTINILKKKTANIQELYRPTLSNAFFWIVYFKIQCPEVVYWQIIQETSLKSRIFLKTNNCFNIHFVPKRKTAANGKYGVYCRYENFVESIHDYKILQDSWHLPSNLTNKQYLKALIKVRFATDSTYTNGFKR